MHSILDYHQQTKHTLNAYAKGPATIDWDSQPSPFRRYANARLYPLPLAAHLLQTKYCELWNKDNLPAIQLNVTSIGAFFELALGLSAWKVYGSARWSLRCNPSSGNLHPTEAYFLANTQNDLPSGLYHYCAKEHGLEQRCLTTLTHDVIPKHSFVLGLSSVPWRESWKYGERAFRYCQLDTGHALMAIQFAARLLGWEISQLETVAMQDINNLLGLSRERDFVSNENEFAELLLLVQTRPVNQCTSTINYSGLRHSVMNGTWSGAANMLDSRHFYEWPAVERAFAASLNGSNVEKPPAIAQAKIARKQENDITAVSVIKTRRSAIGFDGDSEMSLASFCEMLNSLRPSPIYPINQANNVHLFFFVHRVTGLAPGLYCLVRNADTLNSLKQHCRETFLWRKPAVVDQSLSFYCLVEANAKRAARTLSCHQDIASDSTFCISMLADFSSISTQPAHYRHIHWEAGMLGQILYLEAEAATFRGTGIGCFFDDAVHEILGITTETWQVIYHFTVGKPIVDMRISTLQAYGEFGDRITTNTDALQPYTD